MIQPGAVALETVGLTKRYGGVAALTDVGVTIRAGRVTALLGENGAGKSTFVACCSGARNPDAGRILLGGEEQRFSSPHAATRAGVAVVHQEPQMLEHQTVAQNIFLSTLAQRGGVQSIKQIENRAAELLDELGLRTALSPSAAVSQLSGAQRQLVEISRALVFEPRVLFLDEPNASLGEEETTLLFGVVRRLQERGVAVVLISHRLNEVYRIAQDVVIFRDGRKVADGSVDDFPIAAAIESMGGRPRHERAAVLPSAAPSTSVTPAIELRGLTGAGFSNIDLTIRPGEILGMAGLVGSGRTELARGVIGATPLRGGELMVDGVARRFRSPGDAMRHGIVYVAEDRKEAVFYDKSIDFNVRASLLAPPPRGIRLPADRTARELVARLAGMFGIKTPSLDAPASSLSGGNQQKILFARAVSVQPRLLILDEPTHGVDIGTRHDIHEFTRKLAADGIAVWVISSELDEVLDLATRIVVMREGRIVREVPAGADPIPILAAALGTASPEKAQP